MEHFENLLQNKQTPEINQALTTKGPLDGKTSFEELAAATKFFKK